VVYASTFQKITRNIGASAYLLELADSVGCGELPLLETLPSPEPPAELKDPENRPLELGYSDLADYEECGYAYRLSRVFGFERELVSELGYGRAVHHVLRHVAEQARETGNIPTEEEIVQLIDRELYIPFANEATFSNMRTSVRNLVSRYIRDWPEDLSRIWATERPFEIHLGHGILAGRADVILDEEDDQRDHLAIVDYKTSADEQRDERYEMQLTIYAAAGEKEGLEVDACYLHELKNSQRRPVEATAKKREWAVAWAAERVREIASGEYPVKAEQEKCNQCDFKLVCRHSHAVD
jgi:DNA helicase-2/ATP-dependent DNA helicase PcrA